MKRRIKNCREIEAKQAYRTAVLETRKVLFIRKMMWLDIKLQLLDIWLIAHKVDIIILFSEIAGSFAAIYFIYRLSLLFGRIFGG